MRTSSAIPCKKDNLPVYNIRKVYSASLLSFLKKKVYSAYFECFLEKYLTLRALKYLRWKIIDLLTTYVQHVVVACLVLLKHVENQTCPNKNISNIRLKRRCNVLLKAWVTVHVVLWSRNGRLWPTVAWVTITG